MDSALNDEDVRDDSAELTTAVSVAGRNTYADGTVVPEDELQFMVSLRRNGQHVCGGSLLPDLRSVITTAHCVHDAHGNRVPVEHLSVAVGIRQRTHILRSHIFAVHQVVVHPSYDKLRIGNDIAVLRLTGSAAGIDNVAGVRLSSVGVEPPVDAPLLTAGWGRTEQRPFASSSKVLLQTTLRMMDREKCRRTLGLNTIPKSQICAASSTSATCEGDGGGLLVDRRNGADYLVGLISYGASGCQRGMPTVFTKVSHYADWIEHVSNGHTEDQATATAGNGFPFFVVLRHNGVHVCGGSLLPDLQSVITTAHCVHDKQYVSYNF
ncbi:chymotrypsin B-like [Paramacrobiotus metropolitanus]|uniref:chymotrypsin B-like n=1 Tax=Paramacrobiotus metropolitanus TaxID=2943436 RepID=UPI00244645BF|nr:chymotrypsin B-like [Paramacrobiotus metropolitanus]